MVSTNLVHKAVERCAPEILNLSESHDHDRSESMVKVISSEHFLLIVDDLKSETVQDAHCIAQFPCCLTVSSVL